MNKKLIALLMFVISFGLTFTACSDDDDDTTDYASEIAGTYAGSLSIPDLLGENTLSNEIVLSRSGENQVNFELASLSISEQLVVTGIKVSNVPVIKSNDTYTLSSTTQTIEITINGLIPMDAKVAVAGTVENGQMDLKIDVTDIDIADLAITFEGNKQ